AALHTDRAHPHVHIVVNNRGLVNDSWFYMAKDHAFNLETMKSRMVEIAAEEGVLLDATSRLERGILSYGPSRAEIERAKAEGRDPAERPREGKALEEALAVVSQTAHALRGLAHAAALTGLDQIAQRIGMAEARLRQGGVLHPFPAQAVNVGRSDLEDHFGTWMDGAAQKIGRLPESERDGLRKELYTHAAGIARDLGDRRGADLMALPPRTRLYDAAWGASVGQDLVTSLVKLGSETGIPSRRLETRLATGAANAFEERAWLKDDLVSISGRKRLDLRKDSQAQKAAKALEVLHEAAGQEIDRHRSDIQVAEEPLLRTLRSMVRVFPVTGQVTFGTDDQASRFAADLRKRYGDGIAQDLVAGRTDALMRDFPKEQDRSAIAAAVVSAAKSHVGLGISLRDVERSAGRRERHVREKEQDWE
ncbi:MAG: relaxase/mobilization nuclease domain-containing protein, partial [Novosphingobium sp.]|nr:relaxase/mobilization nuclease domain-containing protein [Novosphingobium sp.]